jgi:glucose/arabinose dehydrogenase/PKD repeat protein
MLPISCSGRSYIARAIALAAALVGLLALPAAAHGVTLPPGFQQTTAIGGLTAPTDIEIAAGGRVFVAEKSGLIKTYDSLADTSATTFADLRTQVMNYSARGLLGLAIDPHFPASPYVYVYYTLDAPIGGLAPTFGAAGEVTDECPGDPDLINCVVSARVSRLRVNGDRMEGAEQVLVNDWCQQFAYHAGGGLEFGADGYLYVSGGDGARWGTWDYGQLGSPANPCGDPPGGVGDPLTPPTSEGGRLRAQDLRTGGDPLGLAGSLARIDPATGAGVPGNPMFASTEPNAQRMIAHGFRNPARLAIRPGTNDVWVADRGGGYWEELDRVQGGSDPVRNFGWPCYEGGLDANGDPYARVRPRSDEQDLTICENLYAEGDATAEPYWGYDHELPVVAGESCITDPTGQPIGSHIAGLNFYPAQGSFPAAYRNALFFADEERECMYAMLAGPDGLPARGRVVAFAQNAASISDVETAPNGDLLYADQAGAVRRVAWTGNAANGAPSAAIQADRLSGRTPLTVSFTSTGTSDPDAGDLLTYEWDLEGDGAFDDATDRSATFTYSQSGTYDVSLRVTDTSGASATDTLTIHVSPPAETATLTFPSVADARVEEANPFTNFGTSIRLQATASIPARESYLRFQPAGITGPVVSAKLRLTSTTDGTKDGPALYAAGGGWTETGLTWSTRPARGAAPVADVGAVPLGSVVEYDATSLVTGDGTLDVGLIPTFNDNVDFGSREHAEAAKRPQLVVTFETTSPDNEPPAAPTGLTASAPSQDRVDLSWAAATDNVGVIGYEIYRDGQLLATRGTATTWSDTTVAGGTTYEYAVRALDAASNRSAASNAAGVTTPAAPDTQAPAAPTELVAQAPSPNRVELSWTAATDDVGVTAHEIYRDGALLATLGAGTTYSDTGVAARTTYEYAVRALDAAGNRSAPSDARTVTTPAPPSTTLTFFPIADTRVDENAPTANFGTSPTLQAVGGSKRRESYLRFQLAGVSGRIVSAKLRLASTTDGTQDGPALYTAADTWSETGLTWSNRPARGAAPVADVGAVALGSVAEYDATSLVSGNGVLSLGLVSSSADNVDFGSRELTDAPARPRLVVIFEPGSADTEAPTAPANLTAQAPADGRVDLGWSDPGDAAGVTGYEVLRDGQLIATLGTQTAHTDTAVLPATHYDYAVRALDAAGNRSPASNVAGVTTPTPRVVTTIRFDVVADAHVDEGSPTRNFGGASKLTVVGGTTRRYEGWLRFSLAGITGTVRAAKLRLYVSNDGSVNGPAVYGAPSAWTEPGLTWANRPVRAALPTANLGPTPARTWVEYDVLPLVSGNGALSLVLVGDSTDAASFASKEGDATRKAYLEVTFGDA